jgi:hypothetical protein
MKRLLVLPLLLCPLFAAAQNQPRADFDYGYFQLGYLDFSSDVTVGGTTVDLDGTGFSIDGSLELRDHVHAFLTFRNTELDSTPDADVGTRWGGIGTHWQVADKVSVFGRAGFLDGEGDDGYFASGGVRYIPADGWEVRGGFRHFGWDIIESDTGGFVEGDMWLTDVAALMFSYESVDAADTFTIGMRFYFGNSNSAMRRR